MTRRLGAALALLLVLPLVPAFAELVDLTRPSSLNCRTRSATTTRLGWQNICACR
jgi:hypothetical protein